MNVIDLSLTLRNGMRGVEIRTAKTLSHDGWNATAMSLYSHAGTHMDAFSHFLPDGKTLDRLPLGCCVGPAKLVNLAPAEPSQLFRVSDLGSWQDQIAEGDRLLFRTDWHKRHGTSDYRDRLPRISLELADWLAGRGVRLVGVEPPSVADVNNRDELTAVHQAFFRGGVVVVEGLAHLDRIRSASFQFIALPLKIENGDGCPVRAIAIEDDVPG